MISALLMLSLCSCAGNNEAIPEPEEPQSLPDIESIVEPIANGESLAASEYEIETEENLPGEPEDEPSSVTEPIPEAVQPEPVNGGAVQASSPKAEAQAEAKTEARESVRLDAVARDTRLDCEAIEKELLLLINSLRSEESVNALGIQDSLQFAARIRAAEAFESFSHTRPDETPYNTAFDEAGFSYSGKWHGENLSSLSCSPGAMSEKEIALRMFNGLKDSPGHYRNMTEKNFVQVGIGVAVTYTDGSVNITSAQMFSSL